MKTFKFTIRAANELITAAIERKTRCEAIHAVLDALSHEDIEKIMSISIEEE